MSPNLVARLALAAAIASIGAAASADPPAHTLQDYQYFRALSIDLNGRVPTLDEVTQFTNGTLDVDTYIAQHLTGPAYAERLRRIYMDLMRLEDSPAFNFNGAFDLHREQMLVYTSEPTTTNPNPPTQLVNVYYRRGQRRDNVMTDGLFCIPTSVSGVVIQQSGVPYACDGPSAPNHGLHPIAPSVFQQYVQPVHPWWLYRDYGSATPTQRFDQATWSTMYPLFQPLPDLLTDPNGQPATVAFVCNEEANTSATAPMYAPTSRPTVMVADPHMGNTLQQACSGARLSALPGISSYARMNATASVPCTLGSGLSLSDQCGCGTGLERCMPATNAGVDPSAFSFATNMPLGTSDPLDAGTQPVSAWERFWWSQEAVQFLDHIFGDDRDFRDLLLTHNTWVNGPLVQFYRSIAPTTCCSAGVIQTFNYPSPQPIFDPSTLPNLVPQDTNNWQMVADRGPIASGLLTMPIFLTKFGTRRARAHVLYNAFQCLDFVAPNVQLTPSTEPNLMIRPGCDVCHATLEPMAAYYSRIVESDWTFLPAENFPSTLTHTCTALPDGGINPNCLSYYDPAFTDSTHATLRGAYASAANVEAGPAGLAQSIISSPQFNACVAQNIAQSFLGRPLTEEDQALHDALTQAFASGAAPGVTAPHPLSVRAVVSALVHADAYRLANNRVSNGGAQ